MIQAFVHATASERVCFYMFVFFEGPNLPETDVASRNIFGGIARAVPSNKAAYMMRLVGVAFRLLTMIVSIKRETPT